MRSTKRCNTSSATFRSVECDVNSRMIASEKILADVSLLLPAVRAAADEIEQGGRLPRSIVDGMVAAGVFKLCVPRELGFLTLRLWGTDISIQQVTRSPTYGFQSAMLL